LVIGLPTFPSSEWAAEFCKRINKSEEYRRSAKGWVWPILFTVVDLPDELKRIYGEWAGIYIDLKDGECIDIKFVFEGDSVDAPFVITGSYKDWMDVIEKGMNPVNALVRRKIRLVKGNFSTILRYPKAAIELVNIAKEVGLD